MASIFKKNGKGSYIIAYFRPHRSPAGKVEPDNRPCHG